jgi:hypothetical protein
MKKNTIIKKLETYEEKIIKSINDFQDFLDSIDDPEISLMAEDFCVGVLDFIQENDTCSLVNIREFIEDEYEPEA